MDLAVLPAGAAFFAPVLQASLIPPAQPIAPVVQSTTRAITTDDIPAAQAPTNAASLAQARELQTDLWLTFLAITTGMVIGVVAGSRRRA